jgi:hypothetical protein
VGKIASTNQATNCLPEGDFADLVANDSSTMFVNYVYQDNRKLFACQ